MGKFADLKIGEQFQLLGERCVKVGPLTYKSFENPAFGEQFAGPITDKQIGVPPRPAPKNSVLVTKDTSLETTPLISALHLQKPKPAKKAAPKKAAKKQSKKK